MPKRISFSPMPRGSGPVGYGADAGGKVAHDRDVAGGLCAACDTEQHGSNQQDVAVRGHGKLLENKITVSRFSGIVSPPTGLWGSALWRSRIRLLAPLHELF